MKSFRRAFGWLSLPLVLSGCSVLEEPRFSGDLSPAVAEPPAGCAEPQHDSRPPHDLRLAVERPPEPLRTVPYEYPELAREAGVDGTVIVAALVCEHGRVVDTRVIKSIPMLDQASKWSVERWTFTPARVAGHLTACWTEVPVKFSLH